MGDLTGTHRCTTRRLKCSVTPVVPEPEEQRGREANGEASDEYQRQEEEACDLLDREKDLERR
jgi:hypothetical protein